MDYPNKQIDTGTAAARKPKSSTAVNSEQSFTFPHSPSPIVVTAKDIHEAEKKFKAIISKGE